MISANLKNFLEIETIMNSQKKRWVVYILLLTVLAVIAVWVFHKPGGLKELKQVENVGSGTEQPVAAVNQALEAVRKNEKDKLIPLVLIRDQTEFERNTESLFGQPALHPVRILGCSRLVRSSRKDNLAVYVYSETRKQTYCFSMLKDDKGDYKIARVSRSSRKP